MAVLLGVLLLEMLLAMATVLLQLLPVVLLQVALAALQQDMGELLLRQVHSRQVCNISRRLKEIVGPIGLHVHCGSTVLFNQRLLSACQYATNFVHLHHACLHLSVSEDSCC